MAMPVVMPAFLLGGMLGFALSRVIKKRVVSDIVTLLLMALIPMFMGFESGRKAECTTRAVVSKVTITGSVENVWREVIAFLPIPEPEEYLFRLGIAYPTHAEIKGRGVGAVRYCHFSTGSFVEPITHWEEYKRLAFAVTAEPVPMTELSPYTGIHPPHLDWALRSERGEFLLTDLGNGTVELTGTTWFHTNLSPEPYWGWLSDEVIHRIHLRVLDHIKSTVESRKTRVVQK
ncbi:MAG: hypothetical protein SFY80_07295 [Verrucomicrobiota bacterium]|nr:hypothetical protein [Verrucomicrobiota bacterium]